MLLEFRASNYKSFKDEFEFTMVPAPKQKGLDYSILKEGIGGKEYRGLSTAIIYGPNASGKTNIIAAMDSFKNIVLRGHIRNEGLKGVNAAAYRLDLIPNVRNNETRPVEFYIRFIEVGHLLEYSISLDIGDFMNIHHDRKVLAEELRVNNKTVFHRKDNRLSIGKSDNLKEYWIPSYEKNAKSAHELAEASLHEEDLFLMNGFKNMFSSHLVSLIQNWLQEKLMVIYRADTLEVVGREPMMSGSKNQMDHILFESAKVFGVNSNALSFIDDKDKGESILCSVIENEALNKRTIAPSRIFESFGTFRFVTMYPIILYSLMKGSTLIIDEFDASIHPMAIMSIVNVFHNDEINKKGAQLIFNTHNPIFLNPNLLRRDEIKFVERDEETHSSEHYSLSDFKTTGASGVRNNEDYLKNYFVNKYGAIRDIDFSECISKMLAEGEDGEGNEKEYKEAK